MKEKCLNCGYANWEEGWEPSDDGKGERMTGMTLVCVGPDECPYEEYIEIEKELIKAIYAMMQGEILRLQSLKIPLYRDTQIVVVRDKLREILGYKE
ncbi:MAG: hypothetical protein DDT23_00981 [candidate division WS2 bacterium]|nr:hypothetical protein [Candidatus Lithacetigena glycinireducens]